MDYASSIGAAVAPNNSINMVGQYLLTYIGNSHSITSLVCHRRQQTARESLSELVPPRLVEDPHNLSEHRVQGITHDVSGHHGSQNHRLCWVPQISVCADPKHWLWREEIPPVL
mmetsp:Transcript_49623/g.74894  ORF Transcript_49623/g.74894 Transcript_49623/m.74894 type:complete len:114 (-) Transcript_49623:196-537(-)